MGRTLKFEQITDSRFTPEEECLPILQERIMKIKELLNLDGVSVDIGEPYLIDWTETNREWSIKAAKENPAMRDYYLKEAEKSHIQYRANFYVKKKTRKVTWNDIYRLVNTVKAVPYDFL